MIIKLKSTPKIHNLAELTINSNSNPNSDNKIKKQIDNNDDSDHEFSETDANYEEYIDLNQYKLIKDIGKGTFGNVMLAYNTIDKKLYVKIY
jgi:hypothetical protein